MPRGTCPCQKVHLIGTSQHDLSAVCAVIGSARQHTTSSRPSSLAPFKVTGRGYRYGRDLDRASDGWRVVAAAGRRLAGARWLYVSRAQERAELSQPPNGNNQKAEVTQWVGL